MVYLLIHSSSIYENIKTICCDVPIMIIKQFWHNNEWYNAFVITLQNILDNEYEKKWKKKANVFNTSDASLDLD